MLPIRLLVISLLLVLSFAVHAEDNPADELLGQWYTEDNASKVHITKRNNKYYGTIIWLDEPVYEKSDPEAGKIKHDRKNRDKSLVKRPIIGIEVLKSFSYERGDKTWESGTIYDPEVGKIYKCIIKFEDDPKAEGGKHLYVRGYIGIPTLGRTTLWYRVPKKEEESVETE